VTAETQRSQFLVNAFHLPPEDSQETLLSVPVVAGEALGSTDLMRAQPAKRAVNIRAYAIAFMTDLLQR
jgi:hypothetical protein